MVVPSWILPGRLAAGPRPGFRQPAEETLEWLDRQGVRELYWLSQLPPELPEHLVVHWRPTRDFTPPRSELIREIVERIAAGGPPVYVCCDAGVGRTGTVIACIGRDRGMTPEEALAWARSLLPGAVETSEQETLVREWGDSA